MGPPTRQMKQLAQVKVNELESKMANLTAANAKPTYEVDLKAERRSYLASLPQGLLVLNCDGGRERLSVCSSHEDASSPSQHATIWPWWHAQAGLRACGVA